MTTRDLAADWTPIKGLLRGIQWSLVAAVLLALPLDLLAAYVPLLVLNFWIRWVLGFFVAWIMFAVVHRAAGMAGACCTTIVLLAAAAVFISQHFVFAACGVTLVSGKGLSGDIWLEPTFIFSTNFSTLLGFVIAASLCHEGGAIWQTVAGTLSARVRG